MNTGSEAPKSPAPKLHSNSSSYLSCSALSETTLGLSSLQLYLRLVSPLWQQSYSFRLRFGEKRISLMSLETSRTSLLQLSMSMNRPVQTPALTIF